MPASVAEYWEERLSGGPSLETVGYRALGRNFNRWMYRVRRAQFLERAGSAMRQRGITPSNARVLDAGSGSGFYVECWKQLGVRNMTGCDLTQASVTALRARYPDVAFHRADVGSAEFLADAGPFDAISCMDVLFHIVDDEKYARAISNFARLLEPGGLLIVTENCLHAAPIRTPFQASRSITQIVSQLEQAGFMVRMRVPVFVLMNTPVDSRNRALRAYWNALTRVVARAEAAGWLAGALLYAPERALTRALREGPSTEMLVLQRRIAAG